MATLIIILALCLLPVQAREGGRNSQESTPFFIRVWRYESDGMTDLQVAADETIAVVALADGKLVALDPQNGNLLWTAEPGGTVSAPPLVTASAVFVATSRQDERSSGVLRALDRSTGLPLWTAELAKPIVSELLLHDKKLYGGSADSHVYAVRADTGTVSWAFKTKGPVRGRAVIRGNELLIGSDDGALYALNRDTGVEVWRFQTSGPVVGRPAAGERLVYITSGDGVAYAVDGTTHRQVWRQRTGAAIEAGPLLIPEGVLISSFDNFVYLLDPMSGDRVWKRRMRRRLVSEPIVTGAKAVVAPLRDSQLSMVSLKDGKKIGAFALDAGDELVAAPTPIPGGLVLIPTGQGVLAVVARN